MVIGSVLEVIQRACARHSRHRRDSDASALSRTTAATFVIDLVPQRSGLPHQRLPAEAPELANHPLLHRTELTKMVRHQWRLTSLRAGRFTENGQPAIARGTNRRTFGKRARVDWLALLPPGDHSTYCNSGVSERR